ncbi:hypothetical protein [Maricaulis salignorans]|uniref:Uncharacterized protein n=1 Tax=Maricaulis salignorans TaxID=144026 RepID=A0A1G9U6G7_9PROT|nr:hypothetical protein [Maricaulis salignorans]SDM55452.1 hypothetical protein SAMN04488568_11411 [Maricaulis salignorans]
MLKVLRSAKGLPASALLVATLVLASCGGEADPNSPAADEAAPAASDTVEAADVPAADTPEPQAETPQPEAQQAADPLKGAAPASSPAQSITAAQPAYVGTWGNDLAQCAIAQEYEQPPMIMRADGFDQHEAHCEFGTVTETGPAQWHVTGQCSVEGDEQPLDYNMAIVDGNLQHWSGDARKDAWTLVRCPD